jgi:hypothetical protein
MRPDALSHREAGALSINTGLQRGQLYGILLQLVVLGVGDWQGWDGVEEAG